MNSIDVKTEKANVSLRYQSFHTLTTLFRFLEIIIFLVIVSMFSYQLPFSVRVSADYLKKISFACITPRFVFVVGNVIVLTLLYKSRVAENGETYGKIDVYDECVRRCEKSVVAVQDKNTCKSRLEKIVECNHSERHRKLTRSVTEKRMLKNFDCCGGKKPSLEICGSVASCCVEDGIRTHSEKIMSIESHRKLPRSVTESKFEKPSPEKLINVECNENKSDRKLLPEISRSQSEKVMRVEYCIGSESHRKLKRSVTDCCDGETPNVDELSSEAFRRTVEAFIARQQQSLRDEELAPVPYVGA